MGALKVLIFIFLVSSVVYGLLLVIAPVKLADAKLGPLDLASARYMGATYLGISPALWYAFRDPARNVAVVRALVSLIGLSAVVALVNGIRDDEPWMTAAPTVIFGVIYVVLLVFFSTREEKVT